jgi:pimeloyl-ACP methyl ester carboxylesterase
MNGQEAKTRIDKSDLHVETMGKSGPILLMMHGWGQNLESLRMLGELLSKHAQVHLIDLPGFGSSPAPEADWDTIGYAERILRYLDEKSIDRAILLGHSFGGRVSVRLASRHPERVEAVVLINSGGLKRPPGKWKLKAQLVKILGKSLKSVDKATGSKYYESWFVPKFASIDYKNAGRLRNILVKSVNEDVSEDATRIKSPVFLLWGELDTETPLEMGQRFSNLIPGSQLLVLPGKGHFPFLGDSAHLCARYIIEFLKGLPSSNSEPKETV